jgi:hypothetical protein
MRRRKRQLSQAAHSAGALLEALENRTGESKYERLCGLNQSG